MIASATPTLSDPLLYETEFSHVFTVFPLGQAVEISTNSSALENAALSLWSRYPQLFDSAKIYLRIAVSEQEAAAPPPAPVPRGQGHLVSIIRNADNFGMADLRQGFGFASFTRDVAANRSAVSWDFLEPLVYMMVAARHFAQVHASCVSLGGRGVLLCGDSGAGKTCLAYACALAGWRLVSGDAVQIVRSSKGRDLIGRPYAIRFRESARWLFPELRNHQPRRSEHGKLDIEVDTADLAIGTALEARASHVVFLKRESGVARPHFSTVPFEEAFARLEQVVLYGDKTLRDAQKQTLAELLQSPVVRLTYSDLNGAEQALRRLVE
jgi:hypothetical protein